MKNKLKDAVLELIYRRSEELPKGSEAKRIFAQSLIEEASENTKIYLEAKDRKELEKEILEGVLFPFRRLQSLIDNRDIEEIMINGTRAVFVRYRGQDRTVKTEIVFENPEELATLVEKLLEGSGRRVDWSHPLVDSRLPDGSRINIVSKPLVKEGYIITIRKFPEKAYSIDDLTDNGTISPEIAKFLREAIRRRMNILLVGGTASGKTTLLSSLMGVIAEETPEQRIVIIEETTEIFVPEKLTNTISLETKNSLYDDSKSVTIRDLVKNSLRMRPERIIVGELRAGEAFDMLQAANTGHPGALTTIHANSVRDGIKRLESLVILAGFSQLPLTTISEWIYDSLDLVVFVDVVDGGKRVVTQISGSIGQKLISLYEYDIHKGKYKSLSTNIARFKQNISNKRK